MLVGIMDPKQLKNAYMDSYEQLKAGAIINFSVTSFKMVEEKLFQRFGNNKDWIQVNHHIWDWYNLKPYTVDYSHLVEQQLNTIINGGANDS